MDNSKVDDIVSMLDNLMAADGGHVNVVVDNSAPATEKIPRAKENKAFPAILCGAAQ